MADKSAKTPALELADARRKISELEASQKEHIKQIELLKQDEQRYRQIVQNANSIILLMDKKGNITFLNQFAQRFFGFYEQDIVGKNVIGTIVSDKDCSGRDLVEMISDIEENPERHSVNENENIRSNGERVRVLWTNKAIIDDSGNIKEILCIGNRVTDISGKK